MLLKTLIKNLPKEKKKIKINGLATDSKKVKKGYIFFAIKGSRLNGEKFINEAIKKGASVIICSKNCKYKNKSLLVLKISNIRYLLSEISSKYYKLKPKNIIAVTGTNGKTSVADLFYQILSLNKIPVASIGTLGIKFKGKLIKSNLTSPDTILLHKSLENIKKKRIDNVIIEASSHGLHQKRMDHLNLKVGIFTNFSQDHLDYHKTMKSYLNAKMHLFKNIIHPKKSIIIDKSIKEFSNIKRISKTRLLSLIDINRTKVKLDKLFGHKFNDFQIKNLSMAVEAAKKCNLKENKILRIIKKVKDINGRLQLIKTFPNNIRAFVDFAHTPDALLKSINALKNSYNSDLSLVFGCGGDRDFKKRPLMAKIANEHCKNIYVTDDNPRNEKPEKIRREIIKNINNYNCFNIANRTKAIKTAINNAEPNELILVAGKGHENQQIYKNKIIKISDKKIIENLKVNKKKISNQDLNFKQNKEIIKKMKKIVVKDFHGLSIDTRTLKKNNIFLTIKGKHNDGVKFISQALKKGARYIVSSKNITKHKNKIIKVESETSFLNHFASQKRAQSKAKIIAITGSAGKTSLKNLIKDQLDSFGETFSSPKSFNNYLGVPLSLSELNVAHQFGIFEVGMSKVGEIHSLSNLIKPHVGIITNIGEAHIENFKNLNGIAKAKGEIINNIQKDGILILNRDDKYFNYFKKRAISKNLSVLSFGINKKSDVHPISIKRTKKEKELTLKISGQNLKLKIKNQNIHNVLATLTLLKVLNLNLFKTAYRFTNFQPSEGRGKIYNVKRYKKNFKLIDESYNANPLSVKNAIKNFDSIKKEKFKKYLLLGDMLELGNKSETLHKKLSKVINNSDIDKVFIKGTKTLTTYKNLSEKKRGNIFQQEEDVDFTLNNIIANNDYLMIKGSNATGLNNLSKKIIKGL
ncbi:UDP-N-acetylmuramoyl-L-alanyl-D-glutamate--2,6-diaminopimelate ligase [Candidatus Pelagibacter bacterium]|nr:UDP-N-acetylmuramoyl-L-alanyl-D-glutamate--2,6-diaminopimelate ligase [Candidatus Pelagibacter bacterium]